MESVCGVPYGVAGRGERVFPDWRSVLLRSRDDWSAAELRRAGELAGIHFFTSDPDLKVWSSREFLSAHTRCGGVKTIKLKRRVRRVTELFSRRVVAEDVDRFSDDFSAPDTRLYFLEL